MERQLPLPDTIARRRAELIKALMGIALLLPLTGCRLGSLGTVALPRELIESNTHARLSMGETAHDFGNVAIGPGATHTLAVTNTGGVAATALVFTGLSAPFSMATTCGTSLDAGGSCSVSVTFAPTAPGSAAQELTLGYADSETSTTVTDRFTATAVAGPPSLSYSAGVTSGTVNLPLSLAPAALLANGGAVTACGIQGGSPGASSFPGTLTINASTCAITGTPTAPLSSTPFTIVATNAAGTSAAATVTLAILAGIPALSYAGATGTTGKVNAPMTVSPTTLVANGTAITTCRVKAGSANAESFPPPGLALDDTTCVISGTPTAQMSATPFTIVATNAAGSSLDATVTLTLVDTFWTGIKQAGAAAKTTKAYSTTVDTSGNVYITGETNAALHGATLGASGAGINPDGTDFFLTKYDSDGAFVWHRQVGGGGQPTVGRDVATDSSGNIFVTGDTNANLDGLPPRGNPDYFLTKYDSSGNVLWLRQFGATNTTAYAVAVDAAGNAYIAGETRGALSGNVQQGTKDYFISKYAPDGTRLWIKQFGVASEFAGAFGVGVDASENVFVAGGTTGGLNGQAQMGLTDGFVAKHDSSGNLVWLEHIGAASAIANGKGLTVDASGNVYLGGMTTTALNGNPAHSNAFAFIAKYTGAGSLAWLKEVGNASLSTYGFDVAVSTSGKAYLSGFTEQALDGVSLPTGNQDYFVAQFDSATGAPGWARQLGSAGKVSTGQSVAVDASGNPYVAGDTTGGLAGNTQTGTVDYFLVKYDTAGNRK